MDEQTAKLLIQSLLERAESSSEKVFLSTVEAAAIRILFGKDDYRPVQTPGPTGANQETISDTISFEITSDKIEKNYMMCLDFGTSFSKAFAYNSSSTDGSMLDLKIGSVMSGASELLLPSELFIDDGNIYFGVAARTHFDDVEADQDRLIDSPKQYLTLGSDVAKLSEKDLPQAAKKDSEKRLKQRDALVLFLSHLNLKAEEALSQSGHQINIKRRYTHPAWADEINENNKIATRRILAEAIAISRSYPQFVNSKASLSKLIPILSEARKLDNDELSVPFQLIGDAVREATAAGSGALLSTLPGVRNSFVVVDIGAGTTDVAGCYCVRHGVTGDLKTSEESSAAKAIRQAGNVLDHGLLKLVLDKIPYDSQSAEYGVTKAQLQKMKRQYKEILFSSGELTIDLPDDNNITISLEEFLSQKTTINFVEKLKSLIVTAGKIVDNGNTVYLVPTGGGARLPFIKQIVGEIRTENHSLTMEIRDAMSQELKETNPDLVDPYPQLAVAVGGSMPDLPEQKTNISGGINDPGRTEMRPSYKT